MTLTELARRSGVSYAYLKDIETNGRQPSGVIAHKIAGGLNVGIGDFTASLPVAKPRRQPGRRSKAPA